MLEFSDLIDVFSLGMLFYRNSWLVVLFIWESFVLLGGFIVVNFFSNIFVGLEMFDLLDDFFGILIFRFGVLRLDVIYIFCVDIWRDLLVFVDWLKIGCCRVVDSRDFDWDLILVLILCGELKVLEFVCIEVVDMIGEDVISDVVMEIESCWIGFLIVGFEGLWIFLFLGGDFLNWLV